MSQDVIVIGGGVAGLSAAADLAARGVRVTVLETRPALGGRATVIPDPATGELIDNGQHVLFGYYRETFQFLSRIGAADEVRLQSELEVTFIDQQGRPMRLTCSQAPPPWHLIGGLLEWNATDLRDRLEVLRMIPAIRLVRRQLRGDRCSVAASPGETAENWLIRHGQGGHIREILWEPLALAALNQRPSQAAAPPFARVLGELCGPDRRDSAIGVPTRLLDRLYAEPARAYIEAHDGIVRTGSPARVAIERHAVRGIESNGQRLPAGAVIVAVPWFALGDAVADATEPALAPILSAAASTVSMPVVTVNLWFDRPVLDVPFVALPGRTMQWVFDKRLTSGGDASHLVLVSSGAERSVLLSDQELVSVALREIVGAVPAAQSARLRHATVVRERRATFSLAPGQPRRPDTGTRIAGLFLAGDWVDTGLPGTIESAVRSGHRAAEAVWNFMIG